MADLRAHIRPMLDLSTGHLTYETRDRLDSTNVDAWPVAGGRTTYGFLIWAGNGDDEGDGDGNELPADLVACRVFAREHGCEYLLFDVDGSALEGLPTYDDD